MSNAVSTHPKWIISAWLPWKNGCLMQWLNKYTQRGKQRKETERIIFDPVLHSQGYALQAVATYEERTGRVNKPFSLFPGILLAVFVSLAHATENKRGHITSVITTWKNTAMSKSKKGNACWQEADRLKAVKEQHALLCVCACVCVHARACVIIVGGLT